MPHLLTAPSPSSSSSSSSPSSRSRPGARASSRKMEASYEVLGDSHSDEGAASASGEEADDDVNGEKVRAEVESFVKNQLVRTAVAGLGFFTAVVGLWGDGAHVVFPSERLFIEL